MIPRRLEDFATTELNDYKTCECIRTQEEQRPQFMRSSTVMSDRGGLFPKRNASKPTTFNAEDINTFTDESIN